jgi:hypothetical protein
MNYLSAEDLVFYKDPKDNLIKSMGFDVESLLLNKSVNTPNKGVKISNLFNNLMIPAGLAFQKEEKKLNNIISDLDMDLNLDMEGGSKKMTYDTNTISELMDDMKVIGEDIFSKLVGLVEVETSVISKGTRRNKGRKTVGTKKNKLI